MTEFRAGAASQPLEPPLGLPMMGFIRQKHGATGYGLPLEVGAIALERDGRRVLLCGVDIVGIIHPEIERLIARVAAATGAAPEGILLNWSHTHLAPTGGKLPGEIQGEPDPDARASIDAFARVIQDKIVSVCALAVERLEPAGVVWGQAEVDDAVNRRERTPDGFNGGSILGWNPDAPIDRQVTTLQLRRPDESVIATLVGFGCHPVTTGFDMYIYSADFPGPLRRVVRSVTGGECVFFQGGGGNVLPKFAFTDSEAEAERMGVRLALASLDSVADRFATPVEIRLRGRGLGRADLALPAPAARGRRPGAGCGDRDRVDPARAPADARRRRRAAGGVRARARRGTRLGRCRQGQGRLLPRGLGAQDRGGPARRHDADARCGLPCTRCASATARS